MIAQRGDVDSDVAGHLQNGASLLRRDLAAVDDYLDHGQTPLGLANS